LRQARESIKDIIEYCGVATAVPFVYERQYKKAGLAAIRRLSATKRS
jgi:hypothetical protein